MKVLVIYECVPESTYKTVVALTKEDYELLQHADAYIANIDDYNKVRDEANTIIGWAFCSEEEYREHCVDPKHLGCFGKFADLNSQELAEALKEGVDAVIHTGIHNY